MLLATIIWFPIKTYILDESFDWLGIIGLLWVWHDGVLWFVKTILYLYLIFYLYSFVRIKVNSEPKKMLICMMLFFISVAYALYPRSPYTISVPLFFFGVAVGEFNILRKVFSKIWILSILVICVAVLCFVNRHNMLAIHGLFNYFVVIISLWLCSKWKFSIPKLPIYISNTSFDVYLVHNKVLIISRALLPVVPVWEFILATLIVTIVFYKIRTLLKV